MSSSTDILSSPPIKYCIAFFKPFRLNFLSNFSSLSHLISFEVVFFALVNACFVRQVYFL